MRNLLTASLLAALAGCHAPAGSEHGPDADVRAIRGTLGELYVAFGFEAGGEPDWDTQRRIFLEGATFVAPIRPGRAPAGVGVEAFVTDFREFALEGPFAATGLHERIVRIDVEVHGGIAHAFVLFEGHLPGSDEAVTRGRDSVQLVRAGSGWRLVSFTTQYEDTGPSD